MQTVGDQRDRADAATDADAVDRDQFVADEPDQTCGGDPADVLDGNGVDQAADRLDAATTAESAIIAMTNSPARSSARPKP